MDFIKIGKKGQITLPKAILRAAGIPDEAHMMVEATGDGAIVLRQVAGYPIETYTEGRIEEFEKANEIPAPMKRRVEASLKRGRKKG